MVFIVLETWKNPDVFAYTSSTFENPVLFIIATPILMVRDSSFVQYRFSNLKEWIEYNIETKLKYVYAYLGVTVLTKAILIVFNVVGFDFFLYGFYIILLLFIYTVITITCVLIELFPKKLVSDILSYGYVAILTILIFTGVNISSIFCPIIFLLKMLDINKVYFFGFIVFYVLINLYLVRKIAVGERDD